MCGVRFVRLVFCLALPACVGLSAPSACAQEKKPDERGGTVSGIVTAKGETFIEVKGDGEEKARRYVPEWRGGAPAQGGGPDKEMLKILQGVKVGDRVRLEWKFEERPRVIKLEVVKSASPK